MGTRHRKVSPFFGGAARAHVFIALAAHGPLTTQEIMDLTNMPRANVQHRAEWLTQRDIVVVWRARCMEGRVKPVRAIWALDRQHPWYVSLRNLGRRLASAFPLRGSIAKTHVRMYRGPRKPYHPARLIDNLFGTPAQHRIIMLLAHTGSRSYPLATLARLLGLGRNNATCAINFLECFEIVTTRWRGRERLVRLNRRFPAWREIRRLAHLMDQNCGNEFAGIARLHHWNVEINRRRVQHRACAR